MPAESQPLYIQYWMDAQWTNVMFYFGQVDKTNWLSRFIFNWGYRSKLSNMEHGAPSAKVRWRCCVRWCVCASVCVWSHLASIPMLTCRHMNQVGDNPRQAAVFEDLLCKGHAMSQETYSTFIANNNKQV